MYHFISPLSLPQIVHLSVYSFVHPPPTHPPSTSIEWRNVRRIALRRRRRKRKRRLL